MLNDLNIIQDIIKPKPSTFMKPRDFFFSWSGVATLAYRGFSKTLLGIKREIEEKIPSLSPENPGSIWPKTTLGALRSEETALSIEAVTTLRDICDRFNARIAESDETIHVDQLAVTVFQCRSLEKRLITHPINLTGKDAENDNSPDADHLREVEETMSQFSRSRLKNYISDLNRSGHREKHYRDTHIESTLVFDLKRQQPDYVNQLITEVESELPGLYCWFTPESRHITIRALTSSA